MTISGSTPEEIPLYRVVGPDELASIQATRRFLPSPHGLMEKQFWFTKSDAEWYAHEAISRGWETTVTIVSTMASRGTRHLGVPFPDAGHMAISFTVGPPLSSLNADALRSGIRTVSTIEGAP